jgi:hypothetical protein
MTPQPTTRQLIDWAVRFAIAQGQQAMMRHMMKQLEQQREAQADAKETA